MDLSTDFLIATQKRYSGLELARVSPEENDLHHDAVNRWLRERRFSPTQLLHEVEPFIDRKKGYLIGDDSTLDKRYSRKNELAKLQYSGNVHGLVNGINLVNLLWTDGSRYVPVDYRLYRKGTADHEGSDKHTLFREMLERMKNKGFSPFYVLMDTWYASVETLKFIRSFEWKFVTNLASNRQISVVKGTYGSVQDLDLDPNRPRRVWLKEFGFVLVCKTVASNGDVAYLATNDLSLTDGDVLKRHADERWKIEEFHRGLKQTTGIEQCYSTKASSQKTHIFAAMKAFIKLEANRIKTGMSWYEQKAMIPRTAITNHLAFMRCA